MGTLFVSLILAVIVFFAARSIYKDAKKGGCGGCPYCDSCPSHSSKNSCHSHDTAHR